MIDLEQIRKIDPQDGDVLVLPEYFSPQLVRDFAEALHIAKPGVKCMVVLGDLRRLSVSEMNDAGWYRA